MRMGGVLTMVLVKAPLPDAKDDGPDEAEGVFEGEVAHLRVHQPMLRLMAPFDDDALLARRLRGFRAQDQQVPVNGRGEDEPPQGHDQRPDDDRRLEVEEQDHRGPRHVRGAEVRVQRPELPLRPLLRWPVKLGAGADVQAVLQPGGVGDVAPDEVHNPRNHEGSTDAKDDKEGDDAAIPHEPRAGEGAEAFGIQLIALKASLTLLRAIAGASVAAKHPAAAAHAIL
mmetsp:Transcript_132171/g.368438  ORF Transcript_132171/g.368438 Transcript_132171/m.368438 type:complete len:227 (+) Transcript_132171:1619-2299(+)